jgi:NADH dehydrogenase
MDTWIGETAAQRLRDKGIQVALANPATQVTEDGIAFKDGSFVPSRTIIWAAGVRPSPLVAALPVERGKDGRVKVDETLRVPSHQDAFVLGDCAWFPVPEQDGRPAPPNAQTAVREARVVAQNVAASLTGEPMASYAYANEGNLVALGQGDGVALLGSVRLAGFPAWLAWRGFYLTQLMGFKNRLEVLVEWTSAYFGYRGQPRLDVGPAATPAPAGAAPSQPDAGPAPDVAPVTDPARDKPEGTPEGTRQPAESAAPVRR